MAKELPLTRGLITLVDDADYDQVSMHKWFALKIRHNVYAARDSGGIKNRRYLYLHRVLMNASPGIYIDHINRDSLDNQRSNLRTATNSQNCSNRGAQINNTSGFKGVTFVKATQKWRVRIQVNGINRHLGYSMDPREAAKIYDAAAVLFFGEFACLNFPPLKEAA